MYWSRTLITTLRDDPQEAEIRSHNLLLRAGLIRKLGGGLYTFMPLGLRALCKVEKVVREEMDAAGGIEILMPALQPRDLWERSNRYEAMGDVMFRVKDRQDREMVLGPTHEEVVTDLASREINSWRDMPKTLYQIQTKFRDEIRPRFGLMRAKEFIMKDAYSFDRSWEAADSSYTAMYEAYERIFERCGLKTRVVEADTGAMGGKWSHEFMVLAPSGEDGIVECPECKYAANLERAERAEPPCSIRQESADLKKEPTPGHSTIEQVSEFFKCEPSRLIKTLIYVLDGTPCAILVPGDREVNEAKVARALDANEILLADDATITRVTGAPVGFAGPVGLDGASVYADFALKGATGAITGANEGDTHLTGVSLDRDANVVSYHDFCVARGGDACPKCGAVMNECRGIEVGHVFKLGTKYSEAMGASFLDENGVRQPAVMGCYGIGVTRALQSVVEQSNDSGGIIWPLAISPYQATVLLLNPDHEESARTAKAIAEGLEAEGIDTLVDDRDERPGVKFKDADLIGLTIRIVVGERSLAKGMVEIRLRSEDKSRDIPPDSAIETVIELRNNLLAAKP